MRFSVICKSNIVRPTSSRGCVLLIFSGRVKWQVSSNDIIMVLDISLTRNDIAKSVIAPILQKRKEQYFEDVQERIVLRSKWESYPGAETYSSYLRADSYFTLNYSVLYVWQVIVPFFL